MEEKKGWWISRRAVWTVLIALIAVFLLWMLVAAVAQNNISV
jgi:hypothetical protein